MGTEYKHLSADERAAIHRGRLQSQSPAAIAIHRHVHGLLFDAGFVGAVNILGFEYPVAVLATEHRNAALHAIANNISALTVFSRNKLISHILILTEEISKNTYTIKN